MLSTKRNISEIIKEIHSQAISFSVQKTSKWGYALIWKEYLIVAENAPISTENAWINVLNIAIIDFV